MGNSERSLALQALNQGHPLPDRVRDAPTLFEGLEIYFGAFFDLDTERHHGMGLMPIPWSAILRYARFHEFDYRQTQELLHYVGRMDAWYLEHLAKKMESKK